jgi:hypothetical protein
MTDKISAAVPNYSKVGFESSSDPISAANANLKDVRAMLLEVCVGASYDSATNQICFEIPVYGDKCITSPIPIPVGGDLKICAKTCGPFIPTGVKATVYLNDNPIWNGTIFGSC